MDRMFDALLKVNAIASELIDTRELRHNPNLSWKFHIGAIEHSVQNSDGFHYKLQELMDLSIIEFYVEAEEKWVWAINEDSLIKAASSASGMSKPKPLIIFYKEEMNPMNNKLHDVVRIGITIEIPSPFLYKSDKVVPKNYECNILSMTSPTP